jgi:AcrR family transcriptional regulator
LRKRERTRGELVAAAEHLVAQRGLDAISIDEITEAADVAKGTFYTHFADKNELAAAIANTVRAELEEKVTVLNQGVADAAVRTANGLSTFFALAIEQPVRARALIRLTPTLVHPDMPLNAGIRGDVKLGANTKRFWVSSVEVAVVVLLGISVATVMRLSDPVNRVSKPYDFAIQSLTTALVALGLKQAEAARLAKAAMENRDKR